MGGAGCGCARDTSLGPIPKEILQTLVKSSPTFWWFGLVVWLALSDSGVAGFESSRYRRLFGNAPTQVAAPPYLQSVRSLLGPAVTQHTAHSIQSQHGHSTPRWDPYLQPVRRLLCPAVTAPRRVLHERRTPEDGGHTRRVWVHSGCKGEASGGKVRL